jgi:GNAT superfamily N-acetyltransferase
MVNVRPATLGELSTAAALRAQMAREDGRDWDARHPGWRERFAEFWREKQAAGRAQFFYAESEGTVVGMAAFVLLDEYRAFAFGEPRGWVNSVYVAPGFRKCGIGRRLMEAGLAWLRARGCVMVRLRTSAIGRNLYASLGFTPSPEMELEL